MKIEDICNPSFYILHTPQEPLTWRQRLHNARAELLHFPFLHKHYDVIDVKTLERRRITSTINAGKLFELVLKVLFAVTVVIPIVCFAISYPTASESSWRQVDTLFKQLDEEERKDFLYAFLTKKEIEEDSPFVKLHYIAESYRKSSLEADLLSRLIRLNASVFEEVRHWNDACKTLYAEASSYVDQHNPQITVLYPFLAATDQIRILQQLQTREKDLLKLFPLSTTAALENPGQLAACLIPRELRRGDYGITLQGLPDLFHTAQNLQQRIPKAYQAMETLLTTLPQASVLNIFWKIAKSIQPGIWEQDRKVTVNNLSTQERQAIKALSFEEVLVLHQFEQPWTELWYRVGQSPERLRQACFSLFHDDENSFRQEDNRKNFLNFLSHEDLKDLITEDPDCVELAKIFGNRRELDVRDKTKPKLDLMISIRTEQVGIPHVLMRWWDLYKQIDYRQRMYELSRFCMNEAFLQYFEADHNNYVKMKPFLDHSVNEFIELREYVKEQMDRGNYCSSAENFEHWKQTRQERKRAEQALLSGLRIALKSLGLDPQCAYTRQEFLREFRRWSLIHHPDKDKTEGATARFQEGMIHKNTVIELLVSKGYSKTPVC